MSAMWRKPTDFVSKKWHAFNGTSSLCGNIMLASEVGLYRHKPPRSGCCGACLQQWRAANMENAR